jgi:hypothetical protein
VDRLLVATAEELEELEQRQYDPNRPCLVGTGPSECSTSLALERFPSIIWDTNRYYADLGVPVMATRKQIRDRYLEHTRINGSASLRMTQIVEVLLNPQRRRSYDCTPLGQFYYDQVFEDALYAELLDEFHRLEQETPEAAQSLKAQVEDHLQAAQEYHQEQQELRSTYGMWSYYVWGTFEGDPSDFPHWRCEIAKAFSKMGVVKPPRISMGFTPTPGAFAHVVGNRVVVFVGVREAVSPVLSWIVATEILGLASIQ